MISAHTLSLTDDCRAQHLPLFWRLGVLSTGMPLLWPMTYQQGVVIDCQAKTHGAAYRLVENLLLALWRQTATACHLTLYEYSLRPCFPHLQQLPPQRLTRLRQKKQVKDYLDGLHELAGQRQELLTRRGLASWYDYLALYPDAGPLHVIVLSQVWPDVELLVELNDLCRYGGEVGILPVIILSQRYFPEVPQDEWQHNLHDIVNEIRDSALVIRLLKEQDLRISHAHLQAIADLYHDFAPTVESHEPVVYQDCLASINRYQGTLAHAT